MVTERYISEAADRVMINDLVSRYAFLGDHGPCEDWVALFADNGRWEMPSCQVFARGREQLHQVVSTVLGKLPGVHHIQSNLVVDIDGEKAKGKAEFNAFLLRPDQIASIAQGWYEDDYVKIEGRWYFEVRRVHMTDAALQVQTSGEIGDMMKPMFDQFGTLFAGM